MREQNLVDKTENITNPLDLLRADLASIIFELELEEIPVVLAGDWNFTFKPDSHQQQYNLSKEDKSWHSWMNLSLDDPLTNAFYFRGFTPSYTFSRNHSSSDVDAFLARQSFLKKSLRSASIIRKGSLGATQFSCSGHSPLVIELDLSAQLGPFTDETVYPKANPYKTTFAVLTSKSDTVALFQDCLQVKIQSSQFPSLVQSISEQQSPSQVALDEAYEELLSLLKDTTKLVHERKTRHQEKLLTKKTYKAMTNSQSRRQVYKLLIAFVTSLGRRESVKNDLIYKYSHILDLMDVDFSDICRLIKIASGDIHDYQSLPSNMNPSKAQSISIALAKSSLDQSVAIWRLIVQNIDHNFEQTKLRIVKEARAQRALRYTENGKLKIAQLVREAMAKPPNSKYISSLAVRNESNKLEVVTSPEQLARFLVQKFDTWMGGGGRTFWYDNSPLNALTEEGKNLRRQIALHGSNAVDFDGLGIPKKYTIIFDALKTLPGFDPSQFPDLFAPISIEEWKKYWSSRKSGKAPGLSGVTADMIRACPEDFQTLILSLLNSALRSRKNFSWWKRRLLLPVPKVANDPDINKTRPIMLLDVLSKGFWAILFSRVVPTLERLKAFRSGQFGARPGTNTAEPLTIVFALAELAFSDQVSLYVNNIDVSKAFDSPALGIGVESSLRRLGIDEAFIDYNLDLDIDNKVCVMTAYGTSEEILGSQDGVFSATRGVSQGMSESPLKWNCFHIVLADLQVSHVNEGVVEILNSGLRRTHLRAAPIVDQEHRICSTAFIDDMQLVSTTPRGVELRLNICNLFLEFNAIQFNVDKTRILANLWQGEEYDLAKRTDWSAWIYSTDAIFNESGFCNLSNTQKLQTIQNHLIFPYPSHFP
uniref:Reverse transcriptase domain-containing protein n=2 Tax=Aureoumbra lagunensis TaxID=44058 RepID=A0A7S3JW59_9STRA